MDGPGGPPMAAITGPGGPIIGVWLWHDTSLPPAHPPSQSLSGIATPSSLATTSYALRVASIYSNSQIIEGAIVVPAFVTTMPFISGNGRSIQSWSPLPQ